MPDVFLPCLNKDDDDDDDDGMLVVVGGVVGRMISGGGGVLPIVAYTGRLRPKGVPFSGFRYIKVYKYIKG